MRSSDQYSNRLSCARTCVERMRHRIRTVPARRQVNAWQVRSRTWSSRTTNGAESLSAVCWAALNGSLLLQRVSHYPPRRQKHNLLADEHGEIGCGCAMVTMDESIWMACHEAITATRPLR